MVPDDRIPEAIRNDDGSYPDRDAWNQLPDSTLVDLAVMSMDNEIGHFGNYSSQQVRNRIERADDIFEVVSIIIANGDEIRTNARDASLANWNRAGRGKGSWDSYKARAVSSPWFYLPA